MFFSKSSAVNRLDWTIGSRPVLPVIAVVELV